VTVLTDRHGNLHQGAGSPTGGQFASKHNTRPDALTSPPHPKAEADWDAMVRSGLGATATPEQLAACVAAVRSMAIRQLPNANSIVFELNVTDEGSHLVATGWRDADGIRIDFDEADPVAEAITYDGIFPITGGANAADGSELPGMEELGVETYELQLFEDDPACTHEETSYGRCIGCGEPLW